MNIQKIVWPVFNLGKVETETRGTITGVPLEYLNVYMESIECKFLVIDDKSINANTIGKRRLKLKADGHDLLPIKQAIYTVQDFLKIAKPSIKFIDNTGNIFQYKKSASAYLTCHKIKKIMHSAAMGYIVQIQDIPQRFKMMYEPDPNCDYAGLVQIKGGYILYGLYNVPFKKRRIKI